MSYLINVNISQYVKVLRKKSPTLFHLLWKKEQTKSKKYAKWKDKKHWSPREDIKQESKNMFFRRGVQIYKTIPRTMLIKDSKSVYIQIYTYIYTCIYFLHRAPLSFLFIKKFNCTLHHHHSSVEYFKQTLIWTCQRKKKKIKRLFVLLIFTSIYSLKFFRSFNFFIIVKIIF